jgi:hypothetical protein
MMGTETLQAMSLREDIMKLASIVCNVVALLLLATAAVGQEPAKAEPSDPKAAVEHVLRTQEDAWNHHDLDAFLAGYWKSEELSFFSGAKQTSGWQATLDRYRARYASPGHEMGTLEFSAARGI